MIGLRKALVIAIACLMTGCAAVEPEPLDTTPEPVAVDLTVHAMSGALTSDEELEARFVELLAGGATAIDPADVELYLDDQERRLRGELAYSDLSVVHAGRYVAVRMPIGAIFSMNGSDISPAAYGTLEGISSILGQFPDSVVEIASHTDSGGSEEFNRELSLRRAQSLADFFASREIEADRMLQMAAGASHPVAEGSSAEDRELNHRIEIALIPIRDRAAEAAALAAAATAETD